MNKNLSTLCFGLLISATGPGSADPVKLPIQLDYSLIKKAAISQLFKGENGSADVWHDKKGCSFLKLFNPRISGERAEVKLLNDVEAQLGTGFGGQCIPLLAWAGTLETFQKPTVSPDGSVLSLPVSKANAYDRDGRQLAIGKLQDLIKKVAEPKLADIKVDLKQSRGDIEKALLGFVPKDSAGDIKNALDSLKFAGAEANDDGVKVTLALDAPLKKVAAKPEAPFTEAEQKQWLAIWQEWDTFLTKAIKQAGSETHSQELRDTLTEILLESRSAFQAGLKAQSPGSSDPVRVFFTDTWQKLAPHLKTLAKELPEIEGLRYMTFIAATDVIYELENLTSPFGLEITSDGLRRVARLLMTQKEQAKAH